MHTEDLAHVPSAIVAEPKQSKTKRIELFTSSLDAIQ